VDYGDGAQATLSHDDTRLRLAKLPGDDSRSAGKRPRYVFVMRMSGPVTRDLVWEERRKPGGARAIAYAGTRSSTTRFGAAMLFVVSSLALLWLARRHVGEYPRWVDVVLIMFAIAGLAAAALSSPGSAHGRIEMVDAKMRFVSRGILAGDVEVAVASVVGFSADVNAEGRYRVNAFLRDSARVHLATFGTLAAANEMVRELDQLLTSLRA